MPLDLKQPALCSKASEVQNQNLSKRNIIFYTAVPVHLAMPLVEQTPTVGGEGFCNSANTKPAM